MKAKSKGVPDIVRFSPGFEIGQWVWCLHCERCYKVGEYREVESKQRGVGVLQMCPYADCNGDAVIDPWPWELIREANPSYPRIPKRGVEYPQYGA